ncbi:hypothetical protein BXZ70DRAFT_1012298 [Cristinia sonorae]|uniref:Uncharacterized protein n=1 Tax=Cristinia sonorae TaxID=1940300 RepID=A0A8K0UGT6_9AGAR|nr:hypothetical protein BXZ70DRAFT_1012298 [Cristinia sonorae]
MRILEEVCDAEILARFKDHYLWSCSVKDFQRDQVFAAVFRFDMHVRKAYFTGSNMAFVVDADASTNKFRDIRLDTMEESAQAEVPPKLSSRSDRFSPLSRTLRLSEPSTRFHGKRRGLP